MNVRKKLARLAVAVAAVSGMVLTAAPAHASLYSLQLKVASSIGALCLDADGSAGYFYSGENVMLWTCDRTDKFQIFDWYDDGTIRPSAAPNLCLDASLASGSLYAGANVQLFDCGPRPNQVWTETAGGGIMPTAWIKQGLCLDADMSSPLQNGTNVQIWTWNGGRNQLWWEAYS